MQAIRRHPLFTVWIVVCVTLIAAGLIWGLRMRKSMRLELAGVERKIRQRTQWMQEVQRVEPGTIAASLEQPTAVVTASAGEMMPRKSLDGFIEIAGAVEQLRRCAANQEVSLSADESFGFASYAHQGPPENELPVVHQQIVLTRLLVEKLFAAHPGKLLAVRREPPSVKARETPGGVATDFFALDGRLDLRVAGVIDGSAVRLEFTGQTPVLRSFLQSLAAAPEPLVVRSVEVEPLPAGVKPGVIDSKMSVVVLRAKPIGESLPRKAHEGDGSPVAGGWEKASVLSPGGEQGYELFDLPSRNYRESETAGKLVQPGVPAQTLPVELLAVKREPYRLQLVGYYGAPGDYTGAFVSAGSRDTFLAREGHRFESLGLLLKNISVKKIETKNRSAESGFEVCASALLWDERQQEHVTLTGSERRLTDTPLAVMRFGPPPAPTREFRVGDAFQDETTGCRVQRIQLDPAEVVIVRDLPGQSAPEQFILKPSAPSPAPISTLSSSP